MEDHLDPCSIERETQVNNSLTSKASHLTFHLPTQVRWAHNAKQVEGTSKLCAWEGGERKFANKC